MDKKDIQNKLETTQACKEKTTISSIELKSLIDAYDRLMSFLAYDERLMLPFGALIAINDIGKIIIPKETKNND